MVISYVSFVNINILGELQELNYTWQKLKVWISIFVQKWLNNVHAKACLEIKGPNKKLKKTSTSGNAKESKNSSNPISKNCHTVDYL